MADIQNRPGIHEDALARVVEKGLTDRGITSFERTQSIYEYGCDLTVEYAGRRFFIAIRDEDDEIV